LPSKLNSLNSLFSLLPRGYGRAFGLVLVYIFRVLLGISEECTRFPNSEKSELCELSPRLGCPSLALDPRGLRDQGETPEKISTLAPPANGGQDTRT
jgi:hypothetical protein